MATAPTPPLVSVDEYLNTSYEQDVEFVDGRLVGKGMPTAFHQLLSAILLRWFFQYETEFRFKALADVRTQIIKRARYRLPPMPRAIDRNTNRMTIPQKTSGTRFGPSLRAASCCCACCAWRCASSGGKLIVRMI